MITNLCFHCVGVEGRENDEGMLVLFRENKKFEKEMKVLGRLGIKKDM